MVVAPGIPVDFRPKADKKVADKHAVLLKALGRPAVPSVGTSTVEIAPVAAYASGASYVIVMEIPGIDKQKLPRSKEIEVQAAPRLIVIRINKKAPASSVLQGERRFGMRERQVALPANADHTKATATYDTGVLTVTVPLTAMPAGTSPVKVT
jgi:HSP20 family protein